MRLAGRIGPEGAATPRESVLEAFERQMEKALVTHDQALLEQLVRAAEGWLPPAPEGVN